MTSRFGLFTIAGGIVAVLLFYQNCGDLSAGGSSNVQTSSTAGYEYLAKQIIVRMADANSNAQMTQWALQQNLKLENEWPNANMTNWSWTADMTVEQVQQLLAGNNFYSSVLYSEPNYVYHLASALTWSQVLAMPQSQQVQTSANIKLGALWTGLTPGKTPPIIAVIDSGIDTTHELFVNSGALWKNPGEIPSNGVDDDGNGLIDDVNGYNFVDKNGDVSDGFGHGTHCAGIVLGVGQNIFAQPTTQAKIKIMPLKFIGSDGNGSTSDAINAIYYAVDNGARVISNSWGGTAPSSALQDAIAYAYNHDVLFVVAAGNSSQNIDANPFFPASYRVPNVITVAATDDSDSLASFSNYGVNHVDIAAPGVAVLSTYPTDMFNYLSGTSMATPFVAGTAILQVYERPDMNAFQIKSVLLARADSDTSLASVLGNPIRLNANAAVQEAKVETLVTTEPVYTASSSAPTQDSAPKTGGGCATIYAFNNDHHDGGNPPWLDLVGILLLLLMPKLSRTVIRNRTTPA